MRHYGERMMNTMRNQDKLRQADPAGKAVDTQSGFTLMEVLVAISIFAIGILAVAGMQGMAIRGNGSGNRLTDRLSMAQSQMENIMGVDYANASMTNGNYDDGQSPVVTSWVITDYAGMADTKLITVSVTAQGSTTSISRVRSIY